MSEYNYILHSLDAVRKNPVRPKVYLSADATNPIHAEIQSRIDRFLGSGFEKTPAYVTLSTGMPAAYQGKQIRGDIGDSATSTTDNNKLAIYDLIQNLTGYPPQSQNGQLRTAGTVQRWIDQGNIIFTPAGGGWKYDDAVHFPSPDAAQQGMFALAIGTQEGAALAPPDVYTDYFYPSPAVVSQYGSNLNYFVRCAPDNTGCELSTDVTNVKKDVNVALKQIQHANIGDVLNILNKINPAFIAMRNAFNLLLKINAFGTASTLARFRAANIPAWTHIQNVWKDFGGDYGDFSSNITEGASKKPLL